MAGSEMLKNAFHKFRENLKLTPRRLRERMFSTRQISDISAAGNSQSSNEMKKSLKAFDTILFGIGGIVGAGVFVITGVAAKEHAGPAITFSYLLAALSALLSAFCYSEFAVEMPVTGGAFSYLLTTFGEFPAFLTVSNILLEYLLANAAVARGFTSYFASLCGQGSDSFRIHAGSLELDPVAVLVIGCLVALLCYGTKGSSMFNVVVTILNLFVVAFVILAGFMNGKLENVTNDFHPYGLQGVMGAAALVFFSFIGFDSVATLAEEVGNPARDLPLGIIGSVCIVTVLYVLMSLSLCLMVPYQSIDVNAPFSVAFNTVAGWKWARYIVAFGAVMGILTSLLVNLLGQARIIVVMSRACLLPKAFAHVHEQRGTPVTATIGLGVIASLITFFTSLETLTSMVSIGTLFIFFMVAAALLFKRHHIPGETSPRPFLYHLAVIFMTCVLAGASYQLAPSSYVSLIFIALWFFATLSLQIYVPEVRRPTKFAVPFMPWLASFSLLLNVFLLSTLDFNSYWRFFIWTMITILIYVFYGVHATTSGSDSLSAVDSEGDRFPPGPLSAADGLNKEVEMEELDLGPSDRGQIWGFPSSSVDTVGSYRTSDGGNR